MSNQPKMDKRVLSVRIAMTYYRRLQKMAAEEGKGFNSFVCRLLRDATDGVDLTVQDYAIIQKEMEEAIEKALASGKRVKRA